jgi:hypothetical protein
MLQYIKCSSDRESLINYIDGVYNTYDRCDELENALNKLFPNVAIDDDDPDEGMYANLSTSELQKLKAYLDSVQGEYSGGFTFEFDGNELNVLIEAMENFSQPSFTKDREMSRIARRILNKLTHK